MRIHKEILRVGNHPSGIPLTIPYYRLTGAGKGPRIYIQSGIHGGEVTYWIIEELYRFLENKSFRGEVILVPVANPMAWFQRMYFSTAGKFDWYMGTDWNRFFPGSRTGSLGERLAHQLFSLAEKCDFSIDLHTSRHSIPFGIVSRREDLPFMNIIGLPYTYIMPEGGNAKYERTLTNTLAKKGHISFALECGSHDTYQPDFIGEITAGLKRFLRHIKATTGTAPKQANKQSYYFQKLVTYHVPEGGFVTYDRNIGDRYKKGEILYTLHDPTRLGKDIPIKAKEDGIVLKQSGTHIFWPGDQVLQNIPLSELRLIV